MRVLGWLWVVVLSIEGLVLIYPIWFGSGIPALVQPGRGTALQLIAASILFAAILPTVTREASRLTIFAALSAAVFGWVGTWLILSSENRLLALTLVLLLGFVLYAFVIWMVVLVQIRQGRS